MIKAILFDFDGVVNKFPSQIFSKRFLQDFPQDQKVLEFFNGSYQECVKGKASIKTELSKFIIGSKWEIDELLDYWHKGDTNIDNEIIFIINKLRKSGIKCFLSSNQGDARTDFMKNTLNINKFFDDLYISCDQGFKKPDQKYFEKVYKTIKSKYGFNKNEIIFWDDDQKNVEAGNKFGIKSCFFTNLNDLHKTLYLYGIKL